MFSNFISLFRVKSTKQGKKSHHPAEVKDNSYQLCYHGLFFFFSLFDSIITVHTFFVACRETNVKVNN